MHDRGVRVSGIAKHLGVDHHTAAKALGCSVRVDCGWVRFRALAALVLVPAVARFRPLLPVGPRCVGSSADGPAVLLPPDLLLPAAASVQSVFCSCLPERLWRPSGSLRSLPRAASYPTLFRAGPVPRLWRACVPCALGSPAPARSAVSTSVTHALGVAGFVNPPSVLEHEFGLRLG